MTSVNKCLSLLAYLTAWLAHAPLVQADASVPPVGYAVVVTDSATPMERRAVAEKGDEYIIDGSEKLPGTSSEGAK